MKKTKLFGLAFLATTICSSFSACSNDAEEVLAQESEIKLTSEITPSRVNSLDYQSTQIVSGQQIGVTITGAVGAHENQPWSAGNNGVLNNIGEKVYWGNESAIITAYHPYNKDWTFADANNFSVSTNQTANTNYLASDLLFAKLENQTKQENAVTLTFVHKLSKINVSLTSTDVDSEDLANATISICGTKVTTTFNPSTGEIGNATGDATEIVAGENSKTASAIIIPQMVNEGTKLIRVAISGKIYYYSLAEGTTFTSGKSYTYTLTVKNKQLEVSAKMNITNWIDTPLTGDANETTETEGKVVHVATAGNLSTYIDEEEKLAITSLTVTGELNGDDIRYIREMAGRNSSGQQTEGQLVNLDMSGASIVAGGGAYYSTYTTTANTIGQQMFINCNLKTIILPKTVTSMLGGAFAYCMFMESIELPATLTVHLFAFDLCGFSTENGTNFTISENNNESGNYAIDGVLFYTNGNMLLNRRHIENYTIPEGTTYIALGAFIGNSFTKTLSIPNSVNNIGEHSIGSCTELTELYCYATTPPEISGTGRSAFVDYFDENKSITSKCTLYVPEASINAYKEATHWKEFIDMKPIPTE